MRKVVADKKQKLYLCGLGYFPPYTISLNVLHTLSSCDVIVSDGTDNGLGKILDGFGGRVVRVRDMAACEKKIFMELHRGCSVGWTTRGHPLLFSRGGGSLVRLCRREGISFEIFGSVSSIDIALARFSQALGVDVQGIQACDGGSLEDAREMDIRSPLIVEGAREGKSLGRALLRFYPAAHPCWVLGLKCGDAPKKVRLENVDRFSGGRSPGSFFYIPPRAGR